jgi:3-oxoacyl-[acyl-carrier-protein] synthase-1
MAAERGGGVTALCVIGTSACTAVGLTSAATAAAVRAAISGFAEYPRAGDLTGNPAIVAAPPGVEAIDDPAEALAEMAVAALSPLAEGGPLPVFLALPEARPGLSADFGPLVAAHLTERIPGCRVALSDGAGHAGGGTAIHRAGARLAQNRASVIAVVGADSYLHPDTIAWLDRNRQLHATYNA